MPWNSISPNGLVSVKANQSIGQQNTTYIETTMGMVGAGTINNDTLRDHFWNVGANEDGRHRFINSPGFRVGGLPTDPVIGSGMDGVLYLKSILGRIEGFYRNAQGIYQYIPSYKTGTVTINGKENSDWKTLISVPAQSYGEIFMYQTLDKPYCCSAIFSTDANTVRTFSHRIKIFEKSASYPIEFRNDLSGSLDIQARLGDAGNTYNGDWVYFITYRSQ